MFEPLKKLAKNFKNIDVNKLAKKSLSDKTLQMDIMDLNRQDQLYDRGVDSLGDSLGEYTYNTIQGIPGVYEGKLEKGQRIENITLKDSGDFYKSWRFKNENDGFLFQANAIKEGTDLAQFYGKEIIGLTNENILQVAQWLRPLFIKHFREAILK